MSSKSGGGCAFSPLYWLLLLLGFVYLMTRPSAPEMSYSTFVQQLERGQVSQVILSGKTVTGTLAEPALFGDLKEPTDQFTTALPPYRDPHLRELLGSDRMTLIVRPEGSGQITFALLLPWLLLFGVVYLVGQLLRPRPGGSTPGGLFGIGSSGVRPEPKNANPVTFAEVAGLRSAKVDLAELVDYLKKPERFQRLGAQLPKGLLLIGPPGTGKTLMARAVAGEAGVPFFSISGSRFIEMFVGVGASRVRDLFEKAKKVAPSIIFIDEIDSVGRSRGTGLGGGHDEREQTLNQILAEMDGFDPRQTVVVLAATNRPDVLDPALTRPGRFDRTITLDLPGRKARLEILQLHSRGVPLAPGADLKQLAGRTVGFSGAELKNLINEAALLAGREQAERVEPKHLLEARDRVLLGNQRDEPLGAEERELVAYHEAGHALTAARLPRADALQKVSIIPRGRALGITEQLPEEDRHNLKESYLRDRITILLAGREAERLIFEEKTSGAADDLKKATRLALKMVSQFGMSNELGPAYYRRAEEHVFLGREMTQPKDFSEKTAERIDDEVRRLLKELEERAHQILKREKSRLETLAQALLEQETLERAEILRLLDSAK